MANKENNSNAKEKNNNPITEKGKVKLKKIDKAEAKAKAKAKSKSLLGEFKAFILRGNIVDMAVGVIIGGAFSTIVTSLVEDIIMPLIGILIGKVNFTDLKATVGSAEVMYGKFIQSTVNFLIIAFVLFIAIKMFAKLDKKIKKQEAVEVVKSDETKVLEEIRDMLKAQNKQK